MRRCVHLLAALTRQSAPHKARTVAAAAAAKNVTPTNKKSSSNHNKEEEGLHSLAATFPTYASLWVRASSNKLIQPQHVPYNSKKLVLWRCPACAHQFKQRVYHYVAAGGRCPSCHEKPSLDGASSTTKIKTKNGGGGSGTRLVKNKTKTNNKRSGERDREEVVGNKEAKSIADSGYLVVSEKRDLQPMLAKNFEKEMNKIDLSAETLFVSPKLDGIRCIVGYDKKQKAILFFSRAGTLFECCDAKIEPALHYIFETIDPDLVLDGELYNSSENWRRMDAALASEKNKKKAGQPAAPQTSALATYYQELYASQKKVSATEKSRKEGHQVIHFEALVSAIRTTREKRTAEVAQLQQLLQYHIFDVLYASHFPACNGANVLFSERYAFLQDIIAKTHAHNKKHIPHYDAKVLQVVPSLPVDVHEQPHKKHHKTKKEEASSPAGELTAQMERNIETAISLGYEGIMIRREQNSNNNNNNKMVHNAKQSIHRAKKNHKKGVAPFGGYEHGKRSSCLLKYKKMQDAEFIIVSAMEGKGKLKGSLGAFVCEVPNASSSSKNRNNRKKNATTTTTNKNKKEERKLFYVTPATSEENKKLMWRQWQQHQSYKGKALTVQFQDLSKEGIPRFPIGKCIRGAPDGKDWL